jgi:hypothetical protein
MPVDLILVATAEDNDDDDDNTDDDNSSLATSTVEFMAVSYVISVLLFLKKKDEV